MPDKLPPETEELIVLQRQSIAAIERISRAVTAPRSVRVTRDERGQITGAVSVISGPGDDEDDAEAENEEYGS